MVITKRLLIAAAHGLAFLGLQTLPTYAQGIPVIDVSAIAQLLNQIQQMKQEYTATMQVFGSLVNTLNPNSLATNLIGSQPLPGVSSISGMATGSGNFGNLSGLANQFLQANTLYTPQSTGSNDYNALLLQRNGNSLAGILAMAQTSIQSIQTHISGLTQIQGQLSNSTTEANISAVQGRLQAEQANLTAQDTQAQSLQTMLLAQQQAYQLQQAQLTRQAADSTVTYYGGSTTAEPAAPTITAGNLPTFSTAGQ